MQVYVEEYTTTPCTTDLQKAEFTSFYQMMQLWWEMYNMKCGEFVMECGE